MAALAVAGLTTAAGIGFSNLQLAGLIGTGEAIAGAIATSGGLFAAGRLIAKGIRGDIQHMEDTASKKRGYRPDSDIDDRSVRRRLDFMDQLPIVAGGLTTRNRYQNKQRLRSGRVGRKLQRETAEFIQRWQRIYNFGNSSDSDFGSYPSTVQQWENPGIDKASLVVGYAGSVDLNKNTGRLMLSHTSPVNVATSGEAVNWQFMPGYLFDVTSWRNGAMGNYFAPMKRIAFDENGRVRFINVAQQADPSSNTNSFKSTDIGWNAESGPTGNGFPDEHEQRSLLAWSDIRMCFYAAKKRCSKVHIEFVQFKDPKYTLDFYPDGENILNLSAEDQRDVEMFWINEFKRLTFNPLTVNTFIRNKAIKVLKHESFCINADDANNQDPMPPAVQKSYFKRFNRLCKWNWNTGGLTINPAYVLGGVGKPEIGGLENPDYQQTADDQILQYLNPNARIYMYIRAEDFEPVVGTATMSVRLGSSTRGNIGATVDPAPPGGVVYPQMPSSTFDGTTETVGGLPNATITGFVPMNQSVGNNHYNSYMPTFSASDRFASDDHVSFDIIVRNKWRIQT